MGKEMFAFPISSVSRIFGNSVYILKFDVSLRMSLGVLNPL